MNHTIHNLSFFLFTSFINSKKNIKIGKAYMLKLLNEKELKEDF